MKQQIAYQPVDYNDLQVNLEATAFFQRLTEQNPDDAWAYHNLALAYLAVGAYAQALEAVKQALSLAPDFVLALRTCQRLYVRLGWEKLAAGAAIKAEVLELNAIRLAESHQQQQEKTIRMWQQVEANLPYLPSVIKQ